MNPPIPQLIPQRAPVVMVDSLLTAGEEEAVTCLEVREDNFFLEEDGALSEIGLIEHIAQSASAFAGYKALLYQNAKHPPQGYIGEITEFRCYARPQLGHRLQTRVVVLAEAGDVTLVRGEVKVEDTLVADTRMKIFIERTE